jgi:predicted DNA-binding antitoxin AbrB/MazE fold protein
MRFSVTLECKKDENSLWRRICDLDNFTKYWHGTRKFSYKKQNGEIRASVVFAFGGRGEARVEIDEQKRVFTILYEKGAFKGEQKVWLEKGRICASWDVELQSVFKLFSSWSEAHFKKGTHNALMRLCEDS